MKKLIGLLAGLVFCIGAAAQDTTVTASSITDSDGTLWANGTVSVQFVPNPSTPNPGSYKLCASGAALSPGILNQPPVNLGGTAGFSVTTYDNSQVCPSGSQWQFTVCPNASSKCGIITTPVSGTTQDITTQVNAGIPAPRFIAVPTNFGYADVEAQIQLTPGGLYYNVADACYRQFSGSSFSCVGNGGGLPAGCSSPSTGVIVCTNSFQIGSGTAVTIGPQNTVPAAWVFDLTTPATALSSLAGASLATTTPQSFAGPISVPSLITSSLPQVDVRSAGVLGDGLQLTGCSITTGTTALTCPTASFSASTDMAKGFAVGAAGPGAGVLVSTITAVVSPTQVTLANAASTTQTSTNLIYGTNNTNSWCAMVNCTSPNQPNFIATPTAGRVLRAPRGNYLFFRSAISTGTPPTINTRNGDILQGDGGTNTEFTQIDNTNVPAAATADFLIPNSFNNAGVITSDGGGLFVRVAGMMFQQPFNTSGGCIQTATSAGLGFVSGGEIDGNWFICGVGMKITGNLIWIQNNTCDQGTSECIVTNGSGTTSNNITHDVSITLNDFFLNHFAAVDMNGGADIWVTHNWFSDDFTNGLIIDSGAANFRYHIRDNDFNASVSSFASNQTHLLVQGTCTDCDSENNTFEFGRTNDVVLTNAGIINWLDQGNTYFNSSQNATSGSGVELASIDASLTGSGLTIQDDKFNTVGQYGIISAEPMRLLRNQCFSPFSIATPGTGGNPASGCFQFIDANTGTIEIGQNTTSSTSFPVVGYISQTGTEAETVVSYDNTSGFTSCAVCFDSNRASGSWITSWNENSTNVGANGQTIWGSFFNSVSGAMSLGGSLAVGTTLNVNGAITAQAGKTVPVQSSGTQVTSQVACIKATSPITLGTCSGTVNATTGACGTCN
jgi:hypothetical protein